jgi:hypothetical protein
MFQPPSYQTPEMIERLWSGSGRHALYSKVMTKSKLTDVVYRIFLPPAVSVIPARVGQDA